MSSNRGARGVHARWKEGNPGCAGAALRQLAAWREVTRCHLSCQVPRTEVRSFKGLRETVEYFGAQGKPEEETIKI